MIWIHLDNGVICTWEILSEIGKTTKATWPVSQADGCVRSRCSENIVVTCFNLKACCCLGPSSLSPCLIPLAHQLLCHPAPCTAYLHFVFSLPHQVLPPATYLPQHHHLPTRYKLFLLLWNSGDNKRCGVEMILGRLISLCWWVSNFTSQQIENMLDAQCCLYTI